MQSSTPLEVLFIDVDVVVLLEEVYRSDLISLCSDMNDGKPVSVAQIYVCAIFDEQFYDFKVSPEGGEVQSSETLLVGLAVDPFSDDVWVFLLL